ncbi:hypothetical protein SUGI_0820640 [Cryptomeria japonica]|nr:hypothetical protein SUGI_0820640 [Cryptomeria japonica]
MEEGLPRCNSVEEVSRFHLRLTHVVQRRDECMAHCRKEREFRGVPEFIRTSSNHSKPQKMQVLKGNLPPENPSKLLKIPNVLAAEDLGKRIWKRRTPITTM